MSIKQAKTHWMRILLHVDLSADSLCQIMQLILPQSGIKLAVGWPIVYLQISWHARHCIRIGQLIRLQLSEACKPGDTDFFNITISSLLMVALFRIFYDYVFYNSTQSLILSLLPPSAHRLCLRTHTFICMICLGLAVAASASKTPTAKLSSKTLFSPTLSSLRKHKSTDSPSTASPKLNVNKQRSLASKPSFTIGSAPAKTSGMHWCVGHTAEPDTLVFCCGFGLMFLF